MGKDLSLQTGTLHFGTLGSRVVPIASDAGIGICDTVVPLYQVLLPPISRWGIHGFFLNFLRLSWVRIVDLSSNKNYSLEKYILSSVASLGSFLCGAALSWSAPALPRIQVKV